jgi:hypothetical protein
MAVAFPSDSGAFIGVAGTRPARGVVSESFFVRERLKRPTFGPSHRRRIRMLKVLTNKPNRRQVGPPRAPRCAIRSPITRYPDVQHLVETRFRQLGTGQRGVRQRADHKLWRIPLSMACGKF